MTRPIGWTDEELRKAMSCRGVIAMDGGSVRRFLASLGAVHPTEAREREREAFDKGAEWYRTRNTVFLSNPPQHTPSKDELYPSLLPKSPPPLVLSTGTWRRIDVGCYCGKWDGGDAMVQTTPTIGTRSDAIAFASWLTQYGSEEERK